MSLGLLRKLIVATLVLGLLGCVADDPVITEASQETNPTATAVPEPDSAVEPEPTVEVESTVEPEPDATEGETTDTDGADVAASADGVMLESGVGQVTLRGLAPGATVSIARASGPAPTVGDVDERGNVVLRNLAAANDYTVSGDDGVAMITDVEVLDRVASTPEQAFYDEQAIDEGFGYLTMRDGVTLSAYVVFPGPPEDGPYPTVVEYSGYSPSDPISGIGAFGESDVEQFCGVLPVLCKAPTQVSSLLAALNGYAVVGVNVRGTGCSGGAYDYFDQAQLADAYDVIETVAAQPWVKGQRVGMVGLSYPGISQLYAASTQPPSLAAIAPLSIIGETGTGVIRPGGLLNVGFATQWADNVRTNAEAGGQGWAAELIDEGDTICEANQEVRNHGVDLVGEIRERQFYDDRAATLDGRNFVGDIEVPVFLTSQFQDEQTGGAFDRILEDFSGSPSAKFDLSNGVHVDGYAPFRIKEWKAFLDIYVAGVVPAPDGIFDTLVVPTLYGAIFGAAPPLPDYRWAGVGSVDEAQALWEAESPVKVTFENGAGTDAPGSPVGTFSAEFDSWPPPETEVLRWFLQPGGALVADEPPADGGQSTYNYRDVGLATYYEGGSGGVFAALPPYDWESPPADEALAFISPVLVDDLGLVGTASIDLWVKASADGQAADNVDLEVSITEVRPDGSEMLVQTGFLNTAYRALADDATELRPTISALEADQAILNADTWTPVRISTHAFGHVFRSGSRLRLVIDNPGGDEALWAFEVPERPDGTTIEVAHAADAPSSIALPLIAGLTAPGDVPPCPSVRGQPCRTYTPFANGG